MGIGVRIKRAMEASGRLPVDIATHLGITESAVSQWFAKDSGPKRDRLQQLATFLNTTVPWLLSNDDGPHLIDAPANAAREPVESYPETRVTYPPVMSGRPDIPLWASAAAGDEGAMILVPDPIDYLKRSERMLTVRNPFGFNVLGDSMDPAIEHGDQLIINPSVVARPGLNCVFIHEGPEGMFALVKRLLRSRPDHWHVRQFNPLRDFDLSRKKWARVHPIAEIRKAGV